MNVFLIVVLVFVFLMFLGKRQKDKEKLLNKNSSNNDDEPINKIQKKFKSQLNPYPDRIDAIDWHYKAIQKGIRNDDLELVNLSYAKLIESIRQQSQNGDNYLDYLDIVKSEYDGFRNYYNLPYPKQFLPQTKRKKKNSDNSKLTELIKKLDKKSHPEFKLLRKEYATTSRMPATDFTEWIIEQLIQQDFNSLFAFVSEFYLGKDKSSEKELHKIFKNFLSKDYKSLIEIDDQAIYEIQAFFILKGGIDDFNREFWIAEGKESELLCKILSVYSFKLNVQSFNPLISKANKFLKEMRKETDFWKDYKNYKLDDLKNEYLLNTKTNLPKQLRSISSGKRLHFFDFTSIYTYKKYWNGDSSYKTRSYGINESESLKEISELEIFKRVNKIELISEIASKSELKDKAQSMGFEIKKSWTLKKIIENLSKTEKGLTFLKNYVNEKNILEFKDEFKSDLEIIFKYQSEIKKVVDLIIMK